VNSNGDGSPSATAMNQVRDSFFSVPCHLHGREDSAQSIQS